MLAIDNHAALRFKNLREDFAAFIQGFVDAVASAVQSFKDGQLVIFETFHAKFEPVAAACEKWQIGGFSVHFEAEHDATGDSLDQIIAAKANCSSAMKSLGVLCGYVTASEKLKEAIADAKGTFKHASKLVQDCDRISGIVLLAGIIFNEASTAADIKTILDTVLKTFGMGKDKIPSKMYKMLTDLAKSKGVEMEKEEKEKEKLAKKKKAEVPAEEKASGKAKKHKGEKAEKDNEKAARMRAKEKEKDSKTKVKKSKKAKDEDAESGSLDEEEANIA